MFDGVAFGKEIVVIVKGYVSKAIDPMLKRLEALEGQSTPVSEADIARMIADAIAALPAPQNGKDADIESIGRQIGEAVATAVGRIAAPAPDETLLRSLLADEVSRLPAPRNGTDADMGEIERQIAEAVASAVGTLEVPGPDEALVRSIVADELAKLPPTQAGKDADPYRPTAEELGGVLTPIVDAAISMLAKPQDGKSVTVEELTPLVERTVSRIVSEAVQSIPIARDGVGVADALIDRDGGLVLTLSNGATKLLGQVVGKDADSTDICQMVAKAVADIPKPQNGLDGVGFDDMDISLADDERTLTISAAKGENRKAWTFKLAHVLDRGVFREGATYAKGDGTTFGGSFWISQKDGTTEKPGLGDGWRLAVKKGRDGKAVVTERLAQQPVKVG